MKSLMTALALSTLIPTLVLATGQTWQGEISDRMCGADHKKMGPNMAAPECTVACTKGGVAYVLISGGRAYTLMNHESDLRKYAGQAVTVTGDLRGDTIRVSKVEASAK